METAKFCGHFQFGVHFAGPASVVTAIRGADEARLYPSAPAGFDVEAFLARMARFARRPICAIDEGRRNDLLELIRSHVQRPAWIVSTGHRIGTSYITWYGHCNDWFFQSRDGRCLHVSTIVGESC